MADQVVAAPVQAKVEVQPKVIEATKPAETPKPAEQRIESPTISSADILKRSVAAKPEVKQEEEIQVQAELDKITDPTQRAILEKKLKDLESGYNKKYQSLAEQRKQAEELIKKSQSWTPQRLAEELRKPEFIQAMQTLQQTAPPQTWDGSPEEWSALTSSEKQQFQQMRQETQSLQSQMHKMLQAQEDVEIKKIYPDFEPQVVDEAIEGLRNGQIVASRADIWKVVNHDKNVEKGYQFGYEDGYKKALEKLNGSNPMTGNLNISSADEVPDEVRKGGFSSIAIWRLGRSKNGSTKK